MGNVRVRVGVLADAPKKTGTRTGKRGRQIQQAATLVEVAAAHEFGFNGSAQVKAHARRSVSVNGQRTTLVAGLAAVLDGGDKT